MLKDIFTKSIEVNNKTKPGRKRVKAAYTTLDTPEEVSIKAGLLRNSVTAWLSNERNFPGWTLDEVESFAHVLTLAEVLHVPIAELLTPEYAKRYIQHEKEYPSTASEPVQTSESVHALEPDAVAQKNADYMTPKQVADRLGISAKTVIRCIQAGKLPAIHLGHRYIIAVADAKAWIAANATQKKKERA